MSAVPNRAPIDAFRSDPAGHFRRLSRRKGPTIVTSGGKDAAVVMSLGAYQRLTAAADFASSELSDNALSAELDRRARDKTVFVPAKKLIGELDRRHARKVGRGK